MFVGPSTYSERDQGGLGRQNEHLTEGVVTNEGEVPVIYQYPL